MKIIERISSHWSHICNGDDDGQATTEYALILLSAAVIAVLVITWATAGGGAGRIGDLFDSVFDGVLDKTTQTTVAP